MCGIAGFCNFKYDYTHNTPFYTKILTNMHDCLSHRGNDQFGHYLKNTIGLSHAHLRVRDIAAKEQPIVHQIQHGEYAIIYDGEIYNRNELISDLTRAGYNFQTSSDTEIILYAFLHYGETFVNKLNGIFAFVIWDNQTQHLYFYRDLSVQNRSFII